VGALVEKVLLLRGERDRAEAETTRLNHRLSATLKACEYNTRVIARLRAAAAVAAHDEASAASAASQEEAATAALEEARDELRALRQQLEQAEKGAEAARREGQRERAVSKTVVARSLQNAPPN
jgi:FMN-dependent NADH-azoreductase